MSSKTQLVCQQCGALHAKWQGQCRECSSWNSISVEPVLASSRGSFSLSVSSPMPLSEAVLGNHVRLETGWREFDHVLGGGVVSDSVVLLGGDPGIGKSTLLLQILAKLALEHCVLYVSGEESLQQIALRAHRLNVQEQQLLLLAETQVERILVNAEEIKPRVMVIDSIQTVYSDAITGTPGSVSQVRESAAHLVRFAKQTGVALFLIGHVTKEGALAGPRVLEHMVDVVLYFEGRNDSRHRIIRAVKNRFGAVNEIGVFAMGDRGLQQVSNPSAMFLSQSSLPMSGSTIMATWEGTRSLLVEIQALADTSYSVSPKRVVVGLEVNRLSMLLAVLHRQGGVATYNQDVFVNAVGGLKILETGTDLPVVLAVFSSLRNKNIPRNWVVFGEVGLAGEIRPVQSGQERLKEAARHGFERAIIPKGNAPSAKIANLEVLAVDKLSEVLHYL